MSGASAPRFAIDTIFVPRGAEADAVRSAAARARSSVRVVELGIGPVAAGFAANAAIEANPTLGPSLVTGLCGLLSPAFVVGDTLVYREMRRDGAPTFELERDFGEAVAARLAQPQTGVRAFASDVVVETPAAKLELARRTSAEAVDMESYAVAERLHREGIPVAVLRVGSDGLDDELPELDRALDHAGGLDGFALALAMLRKPAAGARMALNGTRALKALRHAVESVLR